MTDVECDLCDQPTVFAMSDRRKHGRVVRLCDEHWAEAAVKRRLREGDIEPNRPPRKRRSRPWWRGAK